jgi:hypothetical protein
MGLVTSEVESYDLKSKVLGKGGDRRFHARIIDGVETLHVTFLRGNCAVPLQDVLQQLIPFSHQCDTQGAGRVYLNGLFLSKVICKTRPYKTLSCSTFTGKRYY